MLTFCFAISIIGEKRKSKAQEENREPIIIPKVIQEIMGHAEFYKNRTEQYRIILF